MKLPSISLFTSFETYPVHDRDFFLEMALGLWFHTRHLVGKPTRDEIAITLNGWPKVRIEKLIRLLEETSQIA